MDMDERLRAFPLEALEAPLDARGVVVLDGLLTRAECGALAALYPTPEPFRKRVVMARHGYGRGEYQYFTYPLPPLIESLRSALYGRLAPVANRWNERLGAASSRFPDVHSDFVAECHRAGQLRPTPLMLRYGEGDFNCLHQDLYGALSFPLQAVFLLSSPGVDFEGGELVLTEQRPRMQSRAEVVRLAQGSAAIFAVNRRPTESPTRPGNYRRVTMRHGVSRITRGERVTAGIIFHDAE